MSPLIGPEPPPSQAGAEAGADEHLGDAKMATTLARLYVEEIHLKALLGKEMIDSIDEEARGIKHAAKTSAPRLPGDTARDAHAILAAIGLVMGLGTNVYILMGRGDSPRQTFWVYTSNFLATIALNWVYCAVFASIVVAYIRSMRNWHLRREALTKQINLARETYIRMRVVIKEAEEYLHCGQAQQDGRT